MLNCEPEGVCSQEEVLADGGAGGRRNAFPCGAAARWCWREEGALKQVAGRRTQIQENL